MLDGIHHLHIYTITIAACTQKTTPLSVTVYLFAEREILSLASITSIGYF